MKKFTLVMALVFAATTFAEEATRETAKETMLGIRTSLSLSSIAVKKSTHHNVKEINQVGFHAGFLADMNVIGPLYFQPGFMFAQKGGELEIKYPNPNFRDEIIYKTYYLEWPIMFALKIPLGESLDFAVNAGPYLGFGMFGKVIADEISQINSFSSSVFKRFDYGVGFGGGLDFKSFYIGLNYNHGLAEISQDKFNGDAYNRTIGIVLDNKF
ncbi:MAG: PorT family protein [Fibromonadaceae bacterium]|jgi:hypothetical protein|nr:PorT family protein [Fibromonadaceae bacterium]